MRTNSTPYQIEAYQGDGYVVLDALLSTEELRRLRDAVKASVFILGTQLIAGNLELRDRVDRPEECVVQRVNLWKIDSVVKACFLNADLGQMLCEFAVLPGVRLWHDQTFFKPPGGKPTALHLDAPNWSFCSENAMSLWIALDDATYENGCLCYLPGSHKLTRFDQNASLRGKFDGVLQLYPELNRDDLRYVEVSAGSAVLHNGMVLHGAAANRTRQWRRAITCQYMPEGSTFNGRRSVLTKDQLSRLSPGDLLNDDESFPLVWPMPKPALPVPTPPPSTPKRVRKAVDFVKENDIGI
jgi:phytanoyl-CoA hydroxylase